jgi:hypothetical protein
VSPPARRAAYPVSTVPQPRIPSPAAEPVSATELVRALKVRSAVRRVKVLHHVTSLHPLAELMRRAARYPTSLIAGRGRPDRGW